MFAPLTSAPSVTDLASVNQKIFPVALVLGDHQISMLMFVPTIQSSGTNTVHRPLLACPAMKLSIGIEVMS